MKFIDLAKEFSTTVGLNDIVLAGVVGSGFQTFAGYTVGEIVPYKMGMGAEWECGEGVKTVNGIARTTITSSSNGNAKVPFSAGTKEVSCNVAANFLNGVRRERAGEVPFASSQLPLDFKGDTFMAPYTMAGPLTLTIAAGAVRNAWLYARITSDGANKPTMPGSELNGSAGYDTGAGVLNMLMGWYDGYEFVYSWSQKLGAVPLDTTGPTMNGSLASSSVTTNGFTLTWLAASDNTSVAGYEYSIDGGTAWTNIGNVLTKAIAGLNVATQYPTRVRAYDPAGNRSLVPLSLSVTTAATADTTDPTMSGSLTVDNITANGYRMTWPAGADNVAVTGYEYSNDGGTTYNDAGNVLTRTVTGATASTLYPLRVRAYDAAGRRSAPLSASVTTSAAATSGLRFGSLVRVAETGTDPYTYTGSGTSAGFGGTEGDSVLNKAFQSGVDGEFVLKIINTPTTVSPGNWSNELLIGVDSSPTTPNQYGGIDYSVVGHQAGGSGGGGYVPFTSGNPGANSSGAGTLAGDYIKVARVGTALTIKVSKDNGATYPTTIGSWTVSTAAMYVHVLVTGVGSWTPVSQSGLA